MAENNRFKNLSEYLGSPIVQNNSNLVIADNGNYNIINEENGDVIYTVYFDSENRIIRVNQKAEHTVNAVYALTNVAYPLMIAENFKENGKERIKIFVDLSEVEFKSSDLKQDSVGYSQDYFNKNVYPLLKDYTGLEKDFYRNAVLAVSDKYSIGNKLFNLAMSVVIKVTGDFTNFKFVDQKDYETTKQKLFNWLKE